MRVFILYFSFFVSCVISFTCILALIDIMSFPPGYLSEIFDFYKVRNSIDSELDRILFVLISFFLFSFILCLSVFYAFSCTMRFNKKAINLACIFIDYFWYTMSIFGIILAVNSITLNHLDQRIVRTALEEDRFVALLATSLRQIGGLCARASDLVERRGAQLNTEERSMVLTICRSTTVSSTAKTFLSYPSSSQACSVISQSWGRTESNAREYPRRGDASDLRFGIKKLCTDVVDAKQSRYNSDRLKERLHDFQEMEVGPSSNYFYLVLFAVAVRLTKTTKELVENFVIR